MFTTHKKGFTLIELMVVIAIIGILAVSLVPQLTGAQARSRDAARVAGLGSVSAVLETFYADTGAYPLAPSNTSDIDGTANGCLSDSDGVVNSALAEMLKGGTAPVDPQSKNVTAPCATAGSFGYATLRRSGVAQSAYILLANVETYKKANLDYSTATLATDGTTTYASAQAWTGWGKLSSETSNAANSVFAELN